MLVFLFLTGVLGASAAWVTGRAVALTWAPLWHLALYVVLLAGAVRFLDFALFGGQILSLEQFVADGAMLTVSAALGHRVTRAWQMASKYPWLFERAGLLSWRTRRG